MRVIVPEILDTLDASHPEARRSRRDLRRIDAFLGNTRWIVREVGALTGLSVAELGAGDGRLCRQLAAAGARVTGLDLVPAPDEADFEWCRGNFFQTLSGRSFDVIVGSLVLHHFDATDLARLGTLLSRARYLVFAEPLRHLFPLVGSFFAAPFVGRVTRHDMPVSIRAGFAPGELARLLGLEPGRWTIEERRVWRGTVRFRAVRR